MKNAKKNRAIRVLNLYACLGGNRFKWDEAASIQVTAVELDTELARMYQIRFPDDTVIVADAHQYLLDHYKEFDFIWSSPPCPSHSRIRFSQSSSNNKNYNPVSPVMSLYQEIIFLENYFKGKYVVENVIPYYTPLIPAQLRGRHLYWCNFKLPYNLNSRPVPKNLIVNAGKPLESFHCIALSDYKGKQRKDKIARNLVDFEVGKTIFQTAIASIQQKGTMPDSLFPDLFI